MSSACLAPFLYPFTPSELGAALKFARRLQRGSGTFHQRSPIHIAAIPRLAGLEQHSPSVGHSSNAWDRLNPSPDDYSLTPFTDKCLLTLQAGSGGHGCVSFLREKYIAAGPANGGDGGSGGNIFIQAVQNCTSLHTVSKQREVTAGRGGNGQGDNQGGKKGKDILLQVPVGTVIREIRRWDPIDAEEDLARQKKYSKGLYEDGGRKLAQKWLFYPGAQPSDEVDLSLLPQIPKPRRSALAATMPPSPIRLDLDKHMETPLLLAAGAMGGYGNPHFLSREHPRPKVATKGDSGMRLTVALELKLLADVGLVGLPNAGKSTFLRSVSNSRARVGSWAFTTLQPNIGTVILDNHKGRPLRMLRSASQPSTSRTRFTIADIPGLIEDAHLDRGLGLDFLRHVDRAAVLAFVVDLSAGDAVAALKSLWREVGEYETLKDRQRTEESQKVVEWNPFEELPDFDTMQTVEEETKNLPQLVLPPISSKPWVVIATKADMPETQKNFARLGAYVQDLQDGRVEHPSKRQHARARGALTLPISAIKGEGVERVIDVLVDILAET
jgi:GTPase